VPLAQLRLAQLALAFEQAAVGRFSGGQVGLKCRRNAVLGQQ